MKYHARIASGLGVTLALSVLSFNSQTVFAQDNGAVDEVIVTGSRIGRGSDFKSPSPVLTVDREDIENSGYLNLQQLLEKIPATGPSCRDASLPSTMTGRLRPIAFSWCIGDGSR